MTSVASECPRPGGAAPADRTAGAPARRRDLLAHWHGDLRLSRSFWLHAAVPVLAWGLVLGVWSVQIDVGGDDLRAHSVAVLLGWPVWLALCAWGALGTWRAAQRAAAGRALAPWPRAAQAAVMSGAVCAVASTLWGFAPRVPEYAQLAWGIDPTGHLEAALTPDGRRVQLRGPIGMGDAARVRALLARAQGARLIEIASPGGRLGEALDIAQVLRAQTWQVRATGDCENACALVVRAGHRRQASPAAQLGFHRAADGTANPLLRALARHVQERAYAQAGLPEAFIARLMSTPPSVTWYPRAAELEAVGLITSGERPLDVDLPVARGASAQEYVDELLANRTWHAVEQRFPGTAQAAAQRMLAVRDGGADDSATQVEGQRAVQEVLPQLLLDVSPEMRILYLELLAQQLDAVRAQGPQACRDVLVADAARRFGLPPSLAAREAAWLVDATSEPPRSGAHRRTSEVELEVMRRSLGQHAPAQLAVLRQPPSDPLKDADCERTGALLGAVLHLALPERRLAARLAFDPDSAR